MMKKRVVFLMIMLLLCVGCSKQEAIKEQTQETSRDIEEDGTEPFSRIRCVFLSYEDLSNWFKPDENGFIPAEEDLNQYGNKYDTFIQRMVQGGIQIPKVYFGEEMLIPKSKEGYAPISIWSEDASFYRPWLSYDVLMGNTELLIEISYLSEEEVKYAKEHTIDEFLDYISPIKKDIANLNYPWILEVIVEKMDLKDKEVGVLYIKEIDDNHHRSSKIFVYGNMCVRVYGVSSALEAINWQEFSLRTE
ncbi:MAG: hypothetical protein E7283_10215 [Lachnospiraceae bacterium]|nr:hypothetical protein [Lachnospiraceae bacterium]